MNQTSRARRAILRWTLTTTAVLVPLTAVHAHDFWLVPDAFRISSGDWLRVHGQTSSQFPTSEAAGARLHAGSVPVPVADDDTTAEISVALQTDTEGLARIPIDRAGLWNVRALHIVPSDTGTGAEWDTHRVTLVFGIDAAAPHSAGDSPTRRTQAASDSAAVAAVVERFHSALAAGDSIGALAMLAPDAVILENGAVETKEEYRSHHLPSDIAFARAVPSERSPLRVAVRGDVAWATSTSGARGEFRGRQINSQGAELMVLTRTPEGWKISAIHWSSRTLRSLSSTSSTRSIWATGTGAARYPRSYARISAS
jgi:ketosteroid isomerase-like protein